MNFPVVDNDWKYLLANSVTSNHVCLDTLHKGKRYKFARDKESSRVFNWDAHDIAAWYAVIDYCWNKEHNIIPLQMSQIPLPSRQFAQIYDLFTHNTLIWTAEKPGHKKELYPLNNAELEILLQNAVITLGHDETLFCESKRDGDLRDYAWHGM
jgi:hypothetical protein